MQKHPSLGFRAGISVAVLASAALFSPVAQAAPPVIDYPPRDQEVILYQQAAFGVIAGGTAPLSYQWLKNGAPIPGATNDQIVIRQTQFSDEGLYSVLVFNADGSATSAEAELTVMLPKAGDVDGSFPNGESVVRPIEAVFLQPDGKVLIGGWFISTHDAVRGRIARLNSDGTTDHTFLSGLTGADNAVHSIAMQSDGKVLIGGRFTMINDLGRNRIARLNRDGSVDKTFLTGHSGPDGPIRYIIIQADKKILIGGDFTTVNGVNVTNVARLNADGSLDVEFSTSSLEISYVNSMALQKDGKILISTQIAAENSRIAARLVRIHADGRLDESFQSGTGEHGVVSSHVSAIALQPDGKLLIGGRFTKFNGIDRTNLVRLNADGTVANAFESRFELQGAYYGDVGFISLLSVQDDGKVLIGGSFTPSMGTRRRLARLNPDGSLDSTFTPGLPEYLYSIYAMALQDDGKLIVGGGSYTSLVRLNSDGELDSAFRITPVDDMIISLALQEDGKLVLGGVFTIFHGAKRSGIARLNAGGTLDTNFAPVLHRGGLSVAVDSIQLQPDGKLVIVGSFTDVNGVGRTNIARLNADGSLDEEFQPIFIPSGGYVVPAVQPDGRLLVAGSFTSVNGVARPGIARLHSDGTLDSSFQPSIFSGSGYAPHINAIVLQPDGKVIIQENLARIDGVERDRFARLNMDGTLDGGFQSISLTFLETYWTWVSVRLLQRDGGILIGGPFSAVNGVSRQGIARLNADGSLDDSFQTTLTAWPGRPPSLSAVFERKDGTILIGGRFMEVNGVSRNGIAALNPDGTLSAGFENVFIPLPAPYGGVGSILEMSNGRLLVQGGFLTQTGVVHDLALLWAADFQPLVKSPAVADGGCAVTWRAIPNRTYRVQYKDDLSADTWIDLPGEVQAEGHTASKTDASAGGAQRFYRVLRLP